MILAILQARMSSTRLPNKVLKPIMNQPMLALQLARIKQSKRINKLIVATSVQPDDDAIENLCNNLQIDCFRGDLNDVLSRFYHASLAYSPKHVVRLTGDCPLADASVIDQVITEHLKQRADYTSNCQPATFPDGLDVEVFTAQALAISYQNAVKPSEREHVTQFMRNHPDLFVLANYQYHHDLSAYRWTVDEEKDFEFVTQIYQHLYTKNPYFTLQDILALVEKKPQLCKINQGFSRDEGLLKSLQQDKEQGYE
jgi:spore coat polysaccharide biosynthesis protein SpsF